MLTRTFLHCPGIGERRERDLWERGYTDWRRFLDRHPPGGWRDVIACRLDRETAARDLPRREAWRLLTSYMGRTAYLDIETEGMGPDANKVTCVGISDGCSVEAFVAGENLDQVPGALERFDLVVTYNGAGFDLPILQSVFPRWDLRRLRHLDLRFPLARIGLRGGLKEIERRAGLVRAGAVQGADGWTAVLLWRAHRQGHPHALETLVAYCLEDVVHLPHLAARAYNELISTLPLEVPPVPLPSIPIIPFRADGPLVRSLVEMQSVRRSRSWN